jgi:hypothetical protein
LRFNTFIATTGESLARATRSANGEWSVKTLLLGTVAAASIQPGPHRPLHDYAGRKVTIRTISQKGENP